MTHSDVEWKRTAKIPVVDLRGRPAHLHVGVVLTADGKRMAFRLGAYGETLVLPEPHDIAVSFMLQKEIAEDVAEDFGEIG